MFTLGKFITGMALAAVMALSMVISPAKAEPLKLNLISGPVSGGWYVGMGIVGKAITTKFPDAEITMLPGGARVNPLRIERNQADIGIMQVALGTAAAKGLPPFKEKVTNVSGLLNFGDMSCLNFVIREELGVNSIEEIRDRKVPLRVAFGPMGGGGEVYGRWVLGEYGFSYEDIASWGGKLYSNNFDDLANMAKDGLVDMIVWLGRGEAWFIAEVTKDIKMKWLPVNEEVIKRVSEKYHMPPTVVPGKLYAGRVGGKDIPTVGEISGLIVRENLSEETVYKITKAICEGRDDIVQAHANWATFTLQNAWKEQAFPLHPGAVKYYKEIGVMQ